MKTIETVLALGDDGVATLRLPPEVALGEHEVMKVIDGPRGRRAKLTFSSHDVGPWSLAPGETFGWEGLDGDHGP